MRILIVRHAEPDYSIDSLTPKGWREAELLSERLKRYEDADFYCSPLGRAKDTSMPTLSKIGKSAEIHDWLREFSGYCINPKTGERQHPWDLLPSFWTPQSDLYDKDNWIKTPFMQSGDVAERYKEVTSGIDGILERHGYKRENNYYRAQNANTDTVVLFCHFGVECVMLSHLLNISPVCLWQGFVALPSSVTTLITEERENGIAYFRTNGFGDISHLYAADEPPSFAARFCETYSNFEERH